MSLLNNLVWYWDLASADASIVDQHSGLALSRIGATSTITGGAPDGGNCISVGNATGKYRNSSVAKTVNYDAGFSANIWAYSTADSSFGNFVINHRNDGSNPPDNRYFQIFVRASSNTDEAWVLNTTQQRVALVSPTAAQNQWVMFTLVDDGSTAVLYRNGTQVGTGTTTLSSRNTGAAAFAIGGDAWVGSISASTNHRGRLAMAGVWSVALSNESVAWLYNSGLGRRYSELTRGTSRRRRHAGGYGL